VRNLLLVPSDNWDGNKGGLKKTRDDEDDEREESERGEDEGRVTDSIHKELDKVGQSGEERERGCTKYIGRRVRPVLYSSTSGQSEDCPSRIHEYIYTWGVCTTLD
jgi:hypothetical protein